MSEAVLLRTMTEKSQMSFGKYKFSLVGNVLDIGWTGRNYLAWCYYCNSKISFTDSVLTSIGIGKEFRISKPGTSKSSMTRWQESLSSADQRERIKAFKSERTIAGVTTDKKRDRRMRKSMLKRDNRKGKW